MVSGFEEPNEGQHLHRGPGHDGQAALRAQCRPPVPGLRAVSAHERRPERRLRAEESRIREEPDPGAHQGDAGARQAGRVRGPASGPAQRRTAAARGAGPGLGGQPGSRAAGRAAVGPRRQAPTGIEGGAQGDPVGGRRHDDRRDPRPGGSDEPGRQRHRHERGPDHATGPADRDLCRSEDPVRRRVHRSIQLVFGPPRGRGWRERPGIHDQRRAQAAGAWAERAGVRRERLGGLHSPGAHRYRVRAGTPRPAPADPPIG